MVSDALSQQQIIQKFLQRGFLLSSKSLELLTMNQISPQELLDFVSQVSPQPIVIDDSIINLFLAKNLKDNITSDEIIHMADQPHDLIDSPSSTDLTPKIDLELPLSDEKSNTKRESRPISQINILLQIPKRTDSTGQVSDFLRYFKSRYAQMKKILLQRSDIHPLIPFSRLPYYQPEEEETRGKKQECAIIGLIEDKRTTKKGNIVLTLEEPDTSFLVDVIFNDEVSENLNIQTILLDSIIGVRGLPKSLTPGDLPPKKLLFYGTRFLLPDLPIKRPQSDKYDFPESHVLLLSDIHVGNKAFDSKLFQKTLDFIKGKRGTSKQKALASKITSVIIAGDIVDGVGVFPEQDRELLETDVSRQYEEIATFLNQIPTDISIIVVPGNHDASRLALPQVRIPKEYAEPLYEISNITMLGNPAVIEINNRKILIAHGQGLERIIQNDKNIDFHHPLPAAIRVLKYRHLFPEWGIRPQLAPEWHDYLVIDEIPDIFMTGHLHCADVGQYQGTTICMGGCYEHSSKWLQSLNIHPTVGYFITVNLSTLTPTIMRAEDL
ncbi:MAG: metallophosphoesterase [Candidatus Hermodarchaeota archaeon]